MTAQSDWLPMMMATGFDAPLTGARPGPSSTRFMGLALKGRLEGAQVDANDLCGVLVAR